MERKATQQQQEKVVEMSKQEIMVVNFLVGFGEKALHN
jgi:hypothetical protein